MTGKAYITKEDFLSDNIKYNANLPFTEDISVLAREMTIASKKVANRLVCQAMEGCDAAFNGSPDTLTKRRYDRLSKGGAGIIWFEATAVMREGRANPRQLFIQKENADDFGRLVDAIKENAMKTNGIEPLVIMQATHSGRYSKPEGRPDPIIAYNNPIFEKESPIPKERIASDDYLQRVSEALVNAAALAKSAGFDGVDIKCCHRYLCSELLSAYNREGIYGGSFENRTRLLIESVKGARQLCGDEFLVTSRLNVYDGFPYPYGFGVSREEGSMKIDMSESVLLVKRLYDLGVRLINISMGNPYVNPHVNRPFVIGGYEPPEHPLLGVRRMLEGAATIKEAVPEMAVISSGLSYLSLAAPNVASAYIQGGRFDFAGFGRNSLAYPDFARDILINGGMKREKCCICCSKCTQIMRKAGGTPGCVVRDGEVYLPIYKKLCT